jgi:hypothetical protein
LPNPRKGPIMPPSIRAAMPHDVPAMVALLTQDAQRRGSLADAPIEIERALASALNGPQASGQELWLVAEHAAHIVRIARDARSGSPNLRQLCWSARTSP